MNPLSPSDVAGLAWALHRQLAAAFCVSAAIMLGAVMVVLAAARCLRASLVVGVLYGAALCAVPIGRTRATGVCAVAAAAAGLLWPRTRKGPR